MPPLKASFLLQPICTQPSTSIAATVSHVSAAIPGEKSHEFLTKTSPTWIQGCPLHRNCRSEAASKQHLRLVLKEARCRWLQWSRSALQKGRPHSYHQPMLLFWRFNSSFSLDPPNMYTHVGWFPLIIIHTSVYVYLSIYPSLHLSIRPSIYRSIYLPIFLSVSLSDYLSICLSV